MSEPERKIEEKQADPFWLGTRYLKEVGPDGEERSRMVPLREEDLLFPQEEDRLVVNYWHVVNMTYLFAALRVCFEKNQLENQESARVGKSQ